MRWLCNKKYHIKNSQRTTTPVSKKYHVCNAEEAGHIIHSVFLVADNLQKAQLPTQIWGEMHINKTLANWKRKHWKKFFKPGFGDIFLQVTSFFAGAHLEVVDFQARWDFRGSQEWKGPKVSSIDGIVLLDQAVLIAVIITDFVPLRWWSQIADAQGWLLSPKN